MWDSFDPTISGALDGNYYPVGEDDQPNECKTIPANTSYRVMAPGGNYITDFDLATHNTVFSDNDHQIINFARLGGCDITRNTAWGINNKTFYQQRNITVDNNKTFIIAGGGYIHNLNGYSMTCNSGAKIQMHGTVTPQNLIRKNGSDITGIWSTFTGDFLSNLINNTYSGETIIINSGNISISQNITVNPGVILQINSVVTLSFATGKSLTVNGTINADGVTFQRNGSSWNGIIINSSASGSITSCTIKNASSGILFNSKVVTFQYNTIQNNTIGLYFSGIGYSGTYIMGNDLIQNDTAIKCDNYSYPYIFSTNKISNNNTGVYITSSSAPDFGRYSDQGHNSIYNEYYDINSSYAGTI